MYHLACVNCGATYPADEIIYNCKKCGHLLAVKYPLDEIAVSKVTWNRRPISVWRYRELLPVQIKPVTLQEGGTPLYHLKRLGDEMGLPHLYAKHEGMNPSGSFKDRGMTVGVSMALQLGKKSVACASTGNTSASLAVYAAKAGIPAVVLLPAGKVAVGKVAQALMHGAKVISIRGNFDRALEMVHDLCLTHGLYLLNSINPYRLEGQKTIGFEAIDQLGEVPDRIVLPVGNAGNISAVYKGLLELQELDFIDRLPMMTGIQAEGSSPIVRAIRENLPEYIPEANPETIATAIRIGAPVNGEKALVAIRKTRGLAETVTDDEILQMQRDLARKEGIGVEPASAASVAGIRKLVQMGKIDRNEKIVCVVTGHLLKDPELSDTTMRTPDRNRRGPAVAALCAALIIVLIAIPGAGALSADYIVYPNGTAYQASIEVMDSSRYDFSQASLFAGTTPMQVGNVNVSGNCSPCQFNLTTPSVFDNRMAVTFEKGNYTVSYIAPLRDNNLQDAFETPYNVSVLLPQEFDVRNPLLTGLSFGANVTRHPDNTTTIVWNKTTSFDLRFYDKGREDLLYLFGNFFIVIAIVLLLPYLLTMRKKV